ncbi:hypothetical protein AgCh_014092 [Apium graveolens]
MEDAFATIQIEDEETGGFNYENIVEDLSEIDTHWCPVGRFLTESPIDFQAMQYKMASLWRPSKGEYVKQLETNRFIFQFYHEVDIKRVIDGSPWMFGRFHLVLQRLQEGDNPRTVKINKIDLWVQLHDMSAGFMSQCEVINVDNYLETNWDVEASRRNQENAAFPFWCKQGSIQRLTAKPKLHWIEKLRRNM